MREPNIGEWIEMREYNCFYLISLILGRLHSWYKSGPESLRLQKESNISKEKNTNQRKSIQWRSIRIWLARDWLGEWLRGESLI